VVTVLSSWPKRRLRRPIWHALHALSIPAAIAAGVHADQLGTDARAGWYVALVLLMTLAATYPLALRLIGVVQRRSTAAGTRDAGTTPTSPRRSGARPDTGPADDTATPLGDPLLPSRDLVGAGR
jgi:DMSO/TMAO reductase YedYZ heme-binding membrane subunit